MKIGMEEHLEAIQDAEDRFNQLQSSYYYLQEDYNDLMKEYQEYQLRQNIYISSLKGKVEDTLKEDQKIKRDCKIITVLSFILVLLVFVLIIL